MKKLFFTAVALFAFTFAQAQETKFALTAGLSATTASYSFFDESESSSENGFFIGALVDITSSEKFHIQPQLVYVKVKDLQQLNLPVLAKFIVSEKFSILAGPNLSFDISEDSEGIKAFGYGLGFGGSFQLAEKVSLDARYNIGLSNWFEENAFMPEANASVKLSDFQIGLVYTF
jgi:opacity protein-like surface antigen